MLTDTRNSANAKVYPVDGLDVEWTSGFWKERFDTCAKSTVVQLQKMFESKDISHVLENFRICAGEVEGDFDGTVFGDGDFYKWMESAIYAAKKQKNQKLLDEVEEYIALIGRAQQEDGYISTKQIIGERQKNGVTRMGNIDDFEVYNFGHLFTAACLHKRLTGKDNFMRIAVKVADYLEILYEEAKTTGNVQTAVCPSHYMGLIEMYRTSGDKRYFNLAKLAIELRDGVKKGLDDNQDRIPLKKHDKIIGHAVRANYLYAGLADLCLEERDEDYVSVLHKVWRNLVDKKLYITGGCGALYNGASPYGNFFIDQKVHQAYGYEYQLPNITAYNETCASLGGVFWAYRMFQMEPKAEYFDVIERMMLNTNLAALSMDGKKFFYENMLRRTKKMDYELLWPLTRSEYILSYCCPPNLARTIAQSSEYVYTVSDNAIWTGLYGASRAKIQLKNGTSLILIQDTQYPYDGKIHLKAEKLENRQGFVLNLRIPAWVSEGYILHHNKKEILGAKNAGTYFSIEIKAGEKVDILLNFDMKVRYTTAHSMVEEAVGQVAIERGPIVYCCESVDTKIETLDDIWLDLDAKYKTISMEIGGRMVTALEANEYCMNRNGYDRDALYQSLNYQGMSKECIRFIPYFAWDNRTFGEMRIWFPIAYISDKGKEKDLIEEIEQEDFNEKIIVLDDDPTGVQTVHGVSVYTDWGKESIRQGFAEDNQMFFILTNSRSFSKEKTQKVHKEIVENICEISKETGKRFQIISRGDSTLRGHYPLETEVLRQALERQGEKIDGEILCPFFPEGGRYTIENVHYIKEDAILIPVGMTEFAKDKSFGYSSSDLREYVEEKTQGVYKKENCVCIEEKELEEKNINAVLLKLLQVTDFNKVIINVRSYEQLDTFCIAYRMAVKRGKKFLLRTAAAFPKAIANITNQPLLGKEVLKKEGKQGGIVLVGSHVQKTTKQLMALKESDRDIDFIEFPVNICLEEEKLSKIIENIIKETEKNIVEGKTVVIYTSREVLLPNTENKDKILELSVKISESITSIIGKLKVKPAFIIAKGGITSSDVGIKALQVKKAKVMGQVQKGIPVWMTGEESKFPQMPYIIFPGNVGEVDTLRQIVEDLI